jgi:hypothetical protein
VPVSPEVARLRASIAAHVQWANEGDRTARTAAARAGLIARFERQADPQGVLPPDERARRVEHLYLAHMRRMTLASLKARARNRAGDGTA